MKIVTPMRLTDTLKQWLTDGDWQEEPVVDEVNRTSSTSFDITAGDFSLKCYFDVSEKTELFKFYAYFLAVKAPEQQLAEAQKFVTAINIELLLGQLQLVRDKRTIRYYHAIDVKNVAFEPAHIFNLLHTGAQVMEDWLPKYLAICFGGMTAEEVMADE